MTAISPAGDSPSAGQRIAVINSLRGIAIIVVVCGHLWVDQWANAGSFMAGGIRMYPHAFIPSTVQAMALFFMLSGFVLYLPYANGRRTMKSFRDIFEFYKRRARRLLPLYYFTLLISLVFYPYVGHLLGRALIFGTVTFNFFKHTYLPEHNGPLWSIGIEIWACLLLPLLMIIARKIGILRMFGLVLFISICMRIAGLYTPSLTIDWGFNLLTDSALGRLDDFAWGMLLAHIYVHYASTLRAYWFPMGIVGLFLSSNMLNNWFIGIAPLEIRPFANICTDVSVFLIMGGLLALKTGLLRRIITCWPLQMIGLMCYSIYMWHYILIAPLRAMLDPVHTVRYFMILIALSVLSYRYIEFGHVRNIRALLPHARS